MSLKIGKTLNRNCIYFENNIARRIVRIKSCPNFLKVNISHWQLATCGLLVIAIGVKFASFLKKILNGLGNKQLVSCNLQLA